MDQDRLSGRRAVLATMAWPLIARFVRGISLSAFALLLLAVVSEVPAFMVRLLLAYLVCGALSLLNGLHLWPLGNELVWAQAFIWPVLGFVCPFPSGWWWRQSEGGRAPSAREALAYRDSIEMLQAQAAGQLELVLPAAWFVVDSPYPEAAVCAETLMLSRGLMESEYLPAVIAHELGHIAHGDGKLTAAINRLIILQPHKRTAGQPHYRPLSGISLLLRLAVCFARGGYGLRLISPLLGVYWREREYHADKHAARLGQGEELAEFLESYALPHDRPRPFIWLTEHSHPPSELRIERLRAHRTPNRPAIRWRTRGGVAAGPEPVKVGPSAWRPAAATPVGAPLTEPAPSAKASLTSAGQALPSTTQPN